MYRRQRRVLESPHRTSAYFVNYVSRVTDTEVVSLCMEAEAETTQGGRMSKLVSVALNAAVIAAVVEAISAGAKWG
jgi:orotate phosphoribosyltransferase